MTTGGLGKKIVAALLLLTSFATAAQRAETFAEALQKAGDDGVVAYCYGPDWNRRSVLLLRTFWQTPEAEAAVGDAVMVAVPFYERDDARGAGDAARIRGNMPAPAFSVCPTVMFFDRNGRKYAEFQGADYLGSDDACTEGINNMRIRVEAFRRQRELLAQAESQVGEARARLLLEVGELPIALPEGYLQQLELADPTDRLGGLRRHRFDPLKFMYEQLDTPDGFLKPDFVADLPEMKRACLAIVEDEAYSPRDRQAVFNLLIGQSRRDNIQANQLKGYIRRVTRIDPNTDYGRLSPTLMTLWGNNRPRLSSDERRAQREARRDRDRRRRDRERDQRRANGMIEID